MATIDLSSRVTLVTGASSGIGEHFARVLAKSGARVALATRRTGKLQACVAEIVAAGGQAMAVTMDASDEASTIAAYDTVEAQWGVVDTIVANAGIESEKPAVQQDVAEFDRVLATNLRGAFLTMREGARRLIASGSAETERGRMVVTVSITAKRVYPGSSAYSASKAGVRHMSKVLAREWARKGINVNMLLPGYFRTELTRDWADEDHGKKLVASFPRRRWSELSDLDVPLLFLCSDASRGVTGTEIIIDDGQSL